MKSILSYFTAPSSGPTISTSSQSIPEPAKVYEVVEDNHTEQRGSGELVGVPGVIEQANAKLRRMNTDTHSAETDREGAAARLLDTKFLAYRHQSQVLTSRTCRLRTTLIVVRNAKGFVATMMPSRISQLKQVCLEKPRQYTLYTVMEKASVKGPSKKAGTNNSNGLFYVHQG